MVGGIGHLSKNQNVEDSSQAAQKDACKSPACSGQEVTSQKQHLADGSAVLGRDHHRHFFQVEACGQAHSRPNHSRSTARVTELGMSKLRVAASWTIKKAEHRRTDVFELWCWRRLLRVSWTSRGSNQSILKNLIGITLNIHWKD